MVAQTLKYILEGDATGAVNAAKKAQDAVKNATRSLGKLQNEANNITGLQNYSKALIIVRNSLEKNNPALREFNKAIAQTKDEINNLSTTGTKQNGRIPQLKSEIVTLTKLRDGLDQSSNGFSLLNQKIKNAKDEIKKLQSVGIEKEQILPVIKPGTIDALKQARAEIIKIRDSVSTSLDEWKKNNQLIENYTNEIKRLQSVKDEIPKASPPPLDTSTINGLKQYRAELIQQRDAMAKSEAAFASYNKRIEYTTQKLKRLANTGISQVGKSFQGLTARMDKVNAVFARAPFSHIAPQISRFTDGLGRSRTSLRRFATASGSANFAVLGLSQGLQDLPFGFIGLQNNIPMVVQAFSQLRNETGSTRAALKSFGRSIMGSGGIFLGVSALISGLTILTKKYGGLGNAFKAIFGGQRKLIEYQNAYNKALGETNSNITKQATYLANLAKSIKTVNDYRISAIRSANDRAATLNTFYEIATDANRAMNERIGAAKKLKTVFASSLGAFTNTQIVLGEAANAVKNLSDNILQLARSSAAFDTIKANFEKIQEAELFLNNNRINEQLAEAVKKHIDRLKKQLKGVSKTISSPGGTSINPYYQVIAEQISRLTTKYKLLKAPIDDARKTVKKLTSVNGQLISQIRNFDTNTTNSVVPINPEKIETADKILKDFKHQIAVLKQSAKDFSWPSATLLNKELSTAASYLIRLTDIGARFSEQGKQIYNTWLKINSQINGASKLPIGSEALLGQEKLNKRQVPNFKNLSEQLNSQFGGLDKKIAEITAATQRLNEETLKYRNLQRGVEQITQGMFVALVNGENIWKSLIQSLEVYIAKLVAAKAAKIALNAVTGGISSGIGGVLGNIISSITSFANGGIVTSPTLAVIGDSNDGAEYVFNNTQLSALLASRPVQEVHVTGVFEQRGRDLVAVVDNQRDVNTIL